MKITVSFRRINYKHDLFNILNFSEFKICNLTTEGTNKFLLAVGLNTRFGSNPLFEKYLKQNYVIARSSISAITNSILLITHR